MIRKIVQSALCLGLAPLLVAQQVAQQDGSSAPPGPAIAATQITLSRDAAVRFLAPGNIPFAKIQPGTLVRIALDRDVSVGDVKVFDASTPLDGVVVRVIHASRFKNRAAQMVIKVTETVSGRTTDVFLRCYNPDDNLERTYTRTGPAMSEKSFEKGLAITGLVVLALLFVAVFNMDK